MKRLILSLVMLFAMVCQPIFAGHQVVSTYDKVQISGFEAHVYYVYECKVDHTNPYNINTHIMTPANVYSTNVYFPQFNATVIIMFYVYAPEAASIALEIGKNWFMGDYIPSNWYYINFN